MTDKMKNIIVTDHVRPPIPGRSHDWRAVFVDHDEEDWTLPIGWGETEESAVIDLLREALGNGDYDDDLINLALEGWRAIK